MSIGLHFFCTGTLPKINIFQFCEIYAFMATRKVKTTKKFSPSSFLLLLDPGSRIWDPGWEKIRIREENLESATRLKKLAIIT